MQTGAIRFCHFPEMDICGFESLRQAFPAHFHDYCLAGCLVSGKRRLVLHGQNQILAPYELVTLGAWQPHRCEPVDNQPVSWLCAHIPLAAMRRHGFNGPAFFAGAIWKNAALARNFADLALALLARENSVNACLPECAALWNLLRRLAAPDDIPASICAEDNGPAIMISNVCARLRDNPAACFSLESMARLAGMDKFCFLRAFTAVKGITPWRYLENLRLNTGREMLVRGISIAESASSSGFSDQSHFSRTFKAFTGLTPGFFRSVKSVGKHN